jgi:hypothetical protein
MDLLNNWQGKEKNMDCLFPFPPFFDDGHDKTLGMLLLLILAREKELRDIRRREQERPGNVMKSASEPCPYPKGQK